MYYANQRMRTLLRVLYLLRVGIPTGAIIDSLSSDCPESQHLASIEAAEHRSANPGSLAGALVTFATAKASNDGGTEAP